jgi:hypothetical protein
MRRVIWLDSYNILARWRNHFSHLVYVHGVNDVRETEIHRAEPQLPEPSVFEIEMAIEKLKRHKSTGIDQIPAELIKAGNRTIPSEVHKLISSIGIRRNCLRNGRSQSIPIYKKGNKADCSNYRDI